MKKHIIALLTFVVYSNAYSMELHQTKPLRIMTFNVRHLGKETNPKNNWQNRKSQVAQLIKSVHPDIMGLQEPTIEQVEYLATELKLDQYAWVGAGRGAEWFGWSCNEYNPLFYTKERVELVDSGTFTLNPSTVFEFIWNPKRVGLVTRICTWGKFKDKSTNQEFYVYNTHLDNRYQAARINGLESLIKVMEEKKSQLPTILMGDFNMDISTDLLNGQLRNFNNSKALALNSIGPDATRTGWDHNWVKKIDHILISKNTPVSVMQHAVIEETSKDALISDHRPVFVDLLFKQAN